MVASLVPILRPIRAGEFSRAYGTRVAEMSMVPAMNRWPFSIRPYRDVRLVKGTFGLVGFRTCVGTKVHQDVPYKAYVELVDASSDNNRGTKTIRFHFTVGIATLNGGSSKGER